MPATMGTSDALLKEVIEPSVQELLNSDTPLRDKIEKSGSGITTDHGGAGGKYVKFALHITRNTGIGSRREGEDLPRAGQQGYTSGQVNLIYSYGAIEVSGPVRKLAASNPESFVNIVEDEVSKIRTDLGVDMNRQYYGDGSGKLGATMTATGSNVQATIAGFDARNFQEGMYVDVFTAAAFAANVAGTPTAAKAQAYVDYVTLSTTVDAGTVNFTSAVTWASGDVITRYGNVAREITGLKAIVSATGTLYNINPSTIRKWKAVEDSNSGANRPISESMLRYNMDTVRTNGGKVNLVIWGLGVSRAYANLLQQNRQVVNTTALKGGYDSLAFATGYGNVELMDDWTCPPNTIFGLTTGDLKLFEEMDWSWIDLDGSMWRATYGTNGTIKDQYQATIHKYQQMGAMKRNTHFKISDITES